MKLKNFHRLAALGLAVGMTTALAACGNTAETAESTAETAESTETASSEAADAATDETAADAEYAYLADFSFSDAFDENGYLKGVTATDYVTLPDDYADITIDADLGQVSEEDIDNYITSNVLSKFSTTEQVTDRAAADGDTVNIDYVGRIDGVAFDGGDTKGNGADLTLGSGTYVDNFEEQIVGHNSGETFDVTVTFPEDYGNEDLNGKEAVFETTLNYIEDTVTPELSDEWVAENLAATMSLNNVDELKAFVKSTMLYDNQASDVYTALHDKVSYADELPQTALDYYRDVLLYRIYTYAQNYGTDMATLLSSGMMGATYDSVDSYLDDATDSIKSITQQALLMQAVAEKMGFKCDTDTMNADFGRYYGTTDPSQYVSAYGENYIKMNVLQSDVMQNLIDNVKYE
ncbi:MAG: trigger factor [Gemmiger sp.]